jgi:transposase-like protein
MIDAISAEHLEYLRSRVKRGQSVGSVANQYGVGYDRLRKWLRLYDMYGPEYFPPTDDSMEPEESNNKELRKLVEDYGITRTQVADLIGASPETVKNWLRSEDSANFRKMPSYALELIKIKAEQVFGDRPKAKD